MIYGNVELPDFNDGDIVIEAVVLAKVITVEGKTVYREWKSSDLHPVEALGMVTTMEDTLRAMIMGKIRMGGSEAA